MIAQKNNICDFAQAFGTDLLKAVSYGITNGEGTTDDSRTKGNTDQQSRQNAAVVNDTAY